MNKLFVLLWVACASACQGKAESPAPHVGPTAKPPLSAKAAKSATKASARFAVAWSDELALKSLGDVDERLRREDSAGYCELSKGDELVVAKSCVQWFALHAEGYEPISTIEETGDAAARITCGSLQRLKAATPAERSFVRDLKFDVSALSTLPAALATALSREGINAVQRAEQVHKSLHAHDPKARARVLLDPQRLEIVEGDGSSTVTVQPQAWGDLNGDREDDVLVSVVNEMENGSARSARLLVLSRSAPDAVLRVLSSE